MAARVGISEVSPAPGEARVSALLHFRATGSAVETHQVEEAPHSLWALFLIQLGAFMLCTPIGPHAQLLLMPKGLARIKPVCKISHSDFPCPPNSSVGNIFMGSTNNRKKKSIFLS